MSDSIERSERMAAYAQTFGEPDHETSDRMRQHVRAYLQKREDRRRRLRHWLQAGAFAVVVFAAATVWALRDGIPHERAPQGAVTTLETAQQLELGNGRTATIAAYSRVRVLRDDAEELAIELVDGEIELDPAPDDRRVRVESAGHRVEVGGDGVRVRHTGGVPLVVVREGAVRVLGPDLPPQGVRISAPE